jgi:hypothetical protein
LSSGRDLGRELLSSVCWVLALSAMAFVLGTVLSSILYAIAKLIQTLLERPLQDESIGSIRWLDDGPVERG